MGWQPCRTFYHVAGDVPKLLLLVFMTFHLRDREDGLGGHTASWTVADTAGYKASQPVGYYSAVMLCHSTRMYQVCTYL